MILRDVFEGLGDLDWRCWVYITQIRPITLETACLVINPDDAELGHDDTTPIDAMRQNMTAFLSIHDLRGVRDNLCLHVKTPSSAEILSAAVHYEAKDAFLGSDN